MYSYIRLLESENISLKVVAIQTFNREFTKFLITYIIMYKQDFMVLEKLITFYLCSARKDT